MRAKLIAISLLTAFLLAAEAAPESAPQSAPPPPHLSLARRMVDEIRPQDNRYAHGNPTVTWAGLNGATVTTNTSDCTTYVTALLKTAYGLSGKECERLMEKRSPSIVRYYDLAAANKTLRGFKQIGDVEPGDLLISKYAKPGKAAGHMMIVDRRPEHVRKVDGRDVYDVVVIDCTSSPHGSDTRRRKRNVPADEADTGIGRGTIRVYVDEAGTLQSWSWGTSDASRPYSPDDRPITFARVPWRATAETRPAR